MFLPKRLLLQERRIHPGLLNTKNLGSPSPRRGRLWRKKNLKSVYTVIDKTIYLKLSLFISIYHFHGSYSKFVDIFVGTYHIGRPKIEYGGTAIASTAAFCFQDFITDPADMNLR